MLELEEVRDLLDGNRGDAVEKPEIEGAIQALLAHQIVYADTPGFRRRWFELVRTNQMFFERYFNAMGHRLVVEPATSMIALSAGETRYGWRLNRLKKDETLVMIALRLTLDEGFRAGRMDESGRVETNTDEIHDQITRLSGSQEAPLRPRLEEILKWLRRRGGVLLGDRDTAENIVPVIVLPGIRILVDDAFIDAIRTWIEEGTVGDVTEAAAQSKVIEPAESAASVESSLEDDDNA